MKLIQETVCQIFGLLLVFSLLSISSGEETTTVIPESDLGSVTNPTSSNLTVFTINATSDSVSEQNETEIKYKDLTSNGSVSSPVPLSTTTETPITSTSTTSTTTIKPTSEKGYERFKGLDPELEEDIEDEDEDYGEIEVEEGKPGGETESNKFMSKASEITLDHIDFVQLRLKHIARSTSNNITELIMMQKKEFELNEEYKEGWAAGAQLYNSSKRWDLFENVTQNSTTLLVPEEYHIALIAYTLQTPTAMYADFNKKTREVCSGKDVGDFHYKTYFKLLLLAIQALGKETKFKSADRFLYRGVGSFFKLEVGQILAFQQFVSTSTSLKVAENFAEQTLFEMEGPFRGTTMSIRHHSYYEGEEEVIFSPLQVYRVDSKHVGKHYVRYVLMAYEFKMEGEECGFEPVYKMNATKMDKGKTSGGNVTVKPTTMTPLLSDNQMMKVVQSGGESILLAGTHKKINWWTGVILLGFFYRNSF